MDIAAFKDLTKIDALTTLEKALSKLVLTAPAQSHKVRRQRENLPCYRFLTIANE